MFAALIDPLPQVNRALKLVRIQCYPLRTCSSFSEIALFSATFIFAKKQYDAEFHALDAVIAEVAKNTPGYLGEESWENTATGNQLLIS